MSDDVYAISNEDYQAAIREALLQQLYHAWQALDEDDLEVNTHVTDLVDALCDTYAAVADRDIGPFGVVYRHHAKDKRE